MPDERFLSLNNIEMPYSVDAEQAVLGAILKDDSCLHRVNIFISSDSFYLKQHKAIFSAFQTFDSKNKVIDPLPIIDYLVSEGVFDKESGKEYIANLMNSVPSTDNVEIYAKIVKEKYYLRSLIEISTQTIEDALSQSDKADAILDSAEKRIYDIRQGKTSDAPVKISEIISGQVYPTLKNLTGEDKDKYKGYTTGFSDLDNKLAGINKSDLIIIGARPAMGKTSFGLNLARNISLISKKKVVFFSLEMSKEQVAMRVLGTEARVSSSDMRKGELKPEDWISIADATGELSKAELYFDDASQITVPEIKSKIMKLGGVDCAIIDYLGLIAPAVKAENRANEVSQISRSLKAMAKDLNIPVICLAQLNRESEGRGKSHVPQLSDLRDSGSIEQDADIVMFLYRESYYGKENKEPEQANDQEQQPESNSVFVKIAKNRHGLTGDVEFIWDGKYTLFIQKERIHED